jgi:hypothetical protein
MTLESAGLLARIGTILMANGAGFCSLTKLLYAAFLFPALIAAHLAF